MTAVQLTPLELKIKMHPHTRPLLHIAKTFALVIAMALPITAAICTSASATTLRVANQGDALSMDPHSLAEAVQLAFLGNIFEPLVTNDKALKPIPGLATKWSLVSPNVWRFELRKGVKFHDDRPFSADDVVFSLQRARGEGSDMKGNLASVRDIRKVDDYTVDVETNGPNPILPNLLTMTYMMSKSWAEANAAERPVDRRKGVENTATTKANGTGPYRLRERQPSVKTTLTRNPTYWGPIEGNVTEVVFQPISNDATRVAALISNEVDLIDPLPLQDVPKLQANSALRVAQGKESRIVFFGFDQKRDELLYSNVKGKNPFKDKRVRQAFLQAIDTQTIIDKVMRKAAYPAALMVAEGMNGYSAQNDKRLPFDPIAAKRLLTEAGYPDGFEVTLNCPNDRYVNDSEVCVASAAYLARIGVKVRVDAEPKGTYFTKVLKRDTSFFMVGWSPAGYDAHNALFYLMATPAGTAGQGSWNMGAYSNARLDTLTSAIQIETDLTKRTAMMNEALALHRDDVGHIPMHQQSLAWGMRANVEIAQRADNYMFFKWASVR
jgi:peptide/nickel transport system substrate-binding protein